MHVVIVSDFGDVTGGAAKVAIDSAVGLAARGTKVTFVFAIPPLSARLLHPNIAVHGFDMVSVWNEPGALRAAVRGIWNREAGTRLFDLLARCPRGDTIVHIHQWTKALSPSVFHAAAALCMPIAVTLHDYFLSCPNGAHFVFPRLSPCTCRPMSAACLATHCDSRGRVYKLVRVVRQAVTDRTIRQIGPLNVIHVSRFARYVIQRYLPSNIRHFTVPNPVDVLRHAPIDVRANRAFLYLGRLTPEKGSELFARSAAEAGVASLFVGAGSSEERIRQLNPNAEISGWVPPEAIEKVMSRARALVFPSLWQETSGLVALEALSRGLPVIASTRTAPAEVIENGIDGLLFDPEQEGSLGKALAALADGDVAARMGEAAFSRYWASPHTVEKHVDALLQVYEDILALRHRGDGVSASSPSGVSARVH